MLILHTFLALAAGFATMALLVGLATVLLMKLAPAWVGSKGQNGQPRGAYILTNLIYSFVAAMAGGYVTAWIAADNPLIQTLALALIVLLIGALSALQQRGQQPIWYQLVLLGLTPIGVLLGGFLHLKLTGLL